METKDYFENDEVIDLKVYLVVIRRWWWLILLCTVLAGGTACGLTLRKEPIYKASVLMMVGTSMEALNPSSGEMQTSRSLAPTYVVLVGTHSILQDTAVALELPYPPQVKVDASVIPNTQLVRVVVTGPSPKLVAAIANGLAEQLVKQSPQQQLDREFKESATNYIRVVEPARIPTSPTGPKVFQNTLLGASMGLMVAVGVSFVVDFFDDTIKDQEHAQQKLGLKTLGAIPSSDGAIAGAITLVDNPDSPSCDAYSRLATNLKFPQAFSAEEHPLLVTSAGPEEGKSTVVANLAAVMAHTRRVIVVDADMRRPNQHKLLDCSNETGLSTLLGDSLGQDLEQVLEQALQPTTIANLRVLPSGPVPQNPASLLRLPKMAEILRQLRLAADIVMIDAPPAFLSDVGILAGMAVGIVLVIEVGKTRLKVCSQALETIRKAKGNVLGVVLRGVPQKDGYYYPY